MAAQDTSLLSQILSTQKALLSLFSADKKKEDDKGKANVETQKNTGSFNEVVNQLKTLNDTSKKQLETLQSIDKKLVGGAGTSGSTIKLQQNVGENLSSLGTGMIDLAKGLVMLVGGLVFTLLLVPIAPALALATGVIFLTLKAYNAMFEMLGSKETKKKFKDGSENLVAMGTGLALFSLSIAASAASLMLIGIDKVALVVGVIGGFAGIFMLIGKAGDTIEKGAKAASWMGLGMASIGLGVAALVIGLQYAGSVLAGSGGSAVLGGLAALGVLAVAGVTFAIIGVASPLIRSGAIAVAGIGLGLAVFGLGLTVYLTGIAKVMGVGGGGYTGGTKISGGFFDTVGSMLVGLGVISVGAISLILYGTIFALAGQAEFGIPMAIGLGALALAAAGVSLMFFGFGLNYYLGVVAKNSGVSGEGSGMTITADSFKSGFVTNASAIGMLFGVGAIFALAGVVSPLIVLGAAAIGGAGLALISLGAAIKKFNEMVPPGTKIGEDLKTNLVSIREAMLAFVDGENNEGGVLGAMKGLIKGAFTGGKLAVALGNAILIGPALTSIAQGIGAWAHIQNIPKIVGYDKMGQPIYDTKNTANIDKALSNIKTYLPGIVQPFIDLSNMANLTNKSVLSNFTGIDLGDSPFYRGVTASAQMGAALTSVAQGVSSWANLTSVGKFVGYDKNNQPIFETTATAGNVELAIKNITTYLPKIIQPFIDLSTSANLSNSSLLSVTTGADLGDSPFYRGINASASIGAVLSSIAKGISEWANLTNANEFTGYDKNGQPTFKKGSKGGNVELALKNIKRVLSADGDISILQPFIELSISAGLKKEQSLFSIISGADLGETPFAMGIAAAAQIGGVLSSLGQGISSFSKLTAVPEIIGFDKKTGKPVYSGKTSNVTSSLDNLKGIITKLMEIVGGMDEDSVERVNVVSNSLMPFTTFMNKFMASKPADFNKNMAAAFNTIKTFGTINSSDSKKRSFLQMFSDEIKRLSDSADPFTKFTKAFGDMSKNMKVFADNFKLMNPDGIKAFQLWTESINTLSKVSPTTFAANVETANRAINMAYQSSDGNTATRDVPDLFNPVSGAKKEGAIKDANKGAGKPPAALPAPSPMKIDYQALGQAVAAALSTKQLNVYLVGENPDISKKRR